MANLIGHIQGTKGRASRLGARVIDATLETWQGQITVTLRADGEFDIFIGQKGSTGTMVANGNVDDGHRAISLASPSSRFYMVENVLAERIITTT